jgi:hypothetical protein
VPWDRFPPKKERGEKKKKKKKKKKKQDVIGVMHLFNQLTELNLSVFRTPLSIH